MWHEDALQEYRALPNGERRAIQNALNKLQELGDQLGFPHSSAVQGTTGLRELRPRAGRSPWRAFYRRVGDALYIGSIGPEASMNPRGFQSAVTNAVARLTSAGKEQQDNG